MYSLQSNRTIPHSLDPAYLGGLCCRRCALPSPPSELGLEARPTTLRVCGEELAAEGWSRSSEELGGCGHRVEDSDSS